MLVKYGNNNTYCNYIASKHNIEEKREKTIISVWFWPLSNYKISFEEVNSADK